MLLQQDEWYRLAKALEVLEEVKTEGATIDFDTFGVDYTRENGRFVIEVTKE